MTWQPALGAWPDEDGIRFRVWAPDARSVELLLEQPGTGINSWDLQKGADGCFSSLIHGILPGARYRYRVDGQGPFPDPASRFQPEGVHGPSEVVDPRSFRWSDAAWRSVGLEDLVIYELHAGTFTPPGTFAGVTKRLSWLAELGVTAIELMPVADFPGQRNWGYDGVAIFAPARCYGRPDDLRRLVDAAHQLGLAVLLDVVYNHLGPDGNYLGVYSPYYFSTKHHTPWGSALNFDGEGAAMVREFFIENALYWIHEYHLDGLRLDATHGIVDESPRHVLAELTSQVHASAKDRQVLVIAEDHRNLAHALKPETERGWGLDAVWADDFHHQMRRLLAGDAEGYYRDYQGTTADLATTIRQGWFYTGQHSLHRGERRGTDPTGIPPRRFVICLQNHDQVGNRALGERLEHQIDAAAYRAATALLLCAPQTPLIFMGQEWAASTPFLYFTDHGDELGKLVTEGRRQEFKEFSAFTSPEKRALIPDPQALATFHASRLNWSELAQADHAHVVRLYQALLRLRRSEPALRSDDRGRFAVHALSPDALLLERSVASGETLRLVVQLRGAGVVDLRVHADPVRSWETVLTTEDEAFCGDARAPRLQLAQSPPSIAFDRPGAVLLRSST